MPTRSPTGREVRTLLTVSSFGVLVGARVGAAGRVRLGAGCRVSASARSVGERVAAGRVAADHQHGVVAGDGAEDVGELGPVERGGEELRGARRGAQHDQVGRLASAQTSSSPHSRASRLSAAADSPAAPRGPVAALGRARRRPARRTAAADLDRVELDQVARQRRLGDLRRRASASSSASSVCERTSCAVEQLDDPLLPGALGRAGSGAGVLIELVAPAARSSSAFCACSRFSASSQTTLLRAVDDLGGDLLAAVGRQAVHARSRPAGARRAAPRRRA